MRKGTTPDLQLRLVRFLFQHRITPHSTTGVSPAELLMDRHPRSHLDLMHPTTTSRVMASQARKKTGHDRRASKVRSFHLDEAVYAKNSASGPKWCNYGHSRTSLSYEVTLSDHRIIHCHVDRLKSHASSPMDSGSDDDWLLDPVDVSTDTTVTRSMLL